MKMSTMWTELSFAYDTIQFNGFHDLSIRVFELFWYIITIAKFVSHANLNLIIYLKLSISIC